MISKFQNVFFASWIQFPISILSNIIVIRYLGPDLRGEYVLLASSATILSVIASYALPTSILFHVSKAKISYYWGFKIYLVHIFLFFFTASLLLVIFENHFLSIKLVETSNVILFKWYVIFLGISLAINNFFNTIFLGEGNSKNYFKLNLINVLVLLVLIILFTINFSLTPLLVLTAMCISNASASFFAFISAKRSIFIYKISSSKENFRDVFVYAAKRFPSSIFPMIVNQTPTWIIGQTLGLRMLGIFSVALTFFSASLSIPKALSTFLVGEASRRSREQAAILASKSSRIYFALMFMILISSILILPFIIPLLFGTAFIESYLPAIILIGSVMFVASSTSIETYFLSINRPGLITIINFFSMVGILVLMPILTKSFGLPGASLSFLLTRVFVWIVLYNVFKNITDSYQNMIFSSYSEIYNLVSTSLKRITNIRSLFKNK